MTDAHKTPLITGQCYCGATKFHADVPPQTVTYCHCRDCRRVTGAPVAAFAEFEGTALTFTPNAGREISITPGVTRTFCDACGSPISGRYDYLPNTVYISVGLLDQVDDFAPELHGHDASRVAWLHVDDTLPRYTGSARDQLNK